MTETIPPANQALPAAPPVRWRTVAVPALLLVAVQSWLALYAGSTVLPQLLARQLAGYGNLLLLLATLVYLAHLRYRGASVGGWASALAAGGALAVLDGLWLQGAAAWARPAGAPLAPAGLPQVLALFSACTVLLYLVMERVYRSRAAGAFLMPVVAAAVLFGSWLGDGAGAGGAVAPLLRSYVVRAHILANVLAYGAFTLAAAAAGTLLRPRAARAPEAAALMPHAVGFGVALLSLASALGVATAGKAWGRYWDWDPKECATLAVWLVWVGWLWLYHVRGWRGARAGWLVLAGFAATLFGFLGIRLFGAGLHAYA